MILKLLKNWNSKNFPKKKNEKKMRGSLNSKIKEILESEVINKRIAINFNIKKSDDWCVRLHYLCSHQLLF
jgi:2-hydroxy-3-keto-5-methylthiopentenyl-1-phosphate phosphatase